MARGLQVLVPRSAADTLDRSAWSDHCTADSDRETRRRDHPQRRTRGLAQAQMAFELFVERLPGLRLAPAQEIAYCSHATIRGPMALWIEWDAK